MCMCVWQRCLCVAWLRVEHMPMDAVADGVVGERVGDIGGCKHMQPRGRLCTMKCRCRWCYFEGAAALTYAEWMTEYEEFNPSVQEGRFRQLENQIIFFQFSHFWYVLILRLYSNRIRNIHIAKMVGDINAGLTVMNSSILARRCHIFICSCS